MPAFKNMNSLNSFLLTAVSEVLEKDAARAVKKVERRNIEQTVYDATKPRVYKRRGHDWGLADERNMKSEILQDGVLRITNVTKPNKKYKDSLPVTADLPELIEYGDGHNNMNYTWSRSDGTDHEFKDARPFTKNTAEELKSQKQHITALKHGLKNRKIKIK